MRLLLEAPITLSFDPSPLAQKEAGPGPAGGPPRSVPIQVRLEAFGGISGAPGPPQVGGLQPPTLLETYILAFITPLMIFDFAIDLYFFVFRVSMSYSEVSHSSAGL